MVGGAIVEIGPELAGQRLDHILPLKKGFEVLTELSGMQRPEGTPYVQLLMIEEE